LLTSTGRIYASSTQQIYSSIDNKNELANYTFGFVLSNSLPLGGVINVTFPTQFPSNLGYNNTNTLKCTPTCVLNSRTVTFSFSQELTAGLGYNITVNGVTNPPTSGGTGNFWIRSIKGGQTIDENLIFGVIGIANDIGTITTATVVLETQGVQYAGESSKYVFTFTTSRAIPNNNFVRLYLPEGEFGIAKFPSCAAYPVGGKVARGRLVCESTGDNFIDVSGFKDQFSAGTTIAVVVTLTNPAYSHITMNFGIAIMRKFTHIMYDRKLDVVGVTITPGRIFNVYVDNTDKSLAITRNKTMQFALHFKPTNVLKNGSMIQLQFPASFKVFQSTILAQNTMFWVEFGLEDKSEDDPLQISFDDVEASNAGERLDEDLQLQRKDRGR
jgi:hypothetical protein